MEGDPASAAAQIPRTIWFTWFQGLEHAPELVRRCHESWRAQNPGWRLVTLDETSLAEFASLDYGRGALAGQSPNHRSNVLRLELLARHGGVWADATCLCARPLDDWLAPCLPSGFFAFRRPRGERLLSSWFLAAEPGNHLVGALFERMRDYWCRHSFRDSPRLRELLTRRLGRSPSRRALWFSPPVRDVLRVAPYFALHYGFEKLLREDAEAARIWAQTPSVSADPPHGPLRQGLHEPVSDAVREDVDRGETPVYKLTWKLGDRPPAPGSVLAYLFASAGVLP
jgi:hypothetical protein